MREQVLKQFFEGRVSAAELATDIRSSKKNVGDKVTLVCIEDMDGRFSVTRSMLVSLCDAVLAGSLPPEGLRTIGFALEASDNFDWDSEEDELVANVIADWSCPEVNYSLTLENVRRFRAWLLEQEPYPEKPLGVAEHAGDAISVVAKKVIKHRRQT